jgi:hypothetical protein
MEMSGSEKTTVAAMLARRLRWPFIASDNLHSPANKRAIRSSKAWLIVIPRSKQPFTWQPPSLDQQLNAPHPSSGVLPVRSVWLARLAVNPDDMLNGYIPVHGGIGPDIHELYEILLTFNECTCDPRVGGIRNSDGNFHVGAIIRGEVAKDVDERHGMPLLRLLGAGWIGLSKAVLLCAEGALVDKRVP